MNQGQAPRYTWRTKLIHKFMGAQRSFQIGYNREARELYAVITNRRNEIISLMVIEEDQIPLLRKQLDQLKSIRMILGHEPTRADEFTEQPLETWSEEDLKLLKGENPDEDPDHGV